MQLLFAPLQGYTDAEYRNAFHQMFDGIDVYYTPFMRMNKQGKPRNKDIRDIGLQSNQVLNLVPQILVKDVQESTELIKVVKNAGYSEIDINMGCPFSPIVNSGRGSGLLKSATIIKDILESAFQFSEMKISVKVRLGLQEADELQEILSVFEAFPLLHMAIHARTTQQQYKGTPKLEAFEQIYETTSIPLIYNGNLFTVDDLQNCQQKFPKLKGLMMGRGLLQDPFLAQEFIEGPKLAEDEKIKRLVSFHDHLLQSYTRRLNGDHQLLLKIKTLWDYLLPDMDKKIRKKIKKSVSMNKYLDAVGELA